MIPLGFVPNKPIFSLVDHVHPSEALWKEDMGLGGVGRLSKLPGRSWADRQHAQLGLYSVRRSSVVDFSNVSIELEERTHTHKRRLTGRLESDSTQTA